MYEDYIRNSPWKKGDTPAKPPPLNHTRASLANSFEETLGSPTFLKQIVEKDSDIKKIEGWTGTVVDAALRRVSSTLSSPGSSRGGTPPPPGAGGPGGSAANPGISGQLAVRPKADQGPPPSAQALGAGRATRSATTPLDLPSADGFLVMHRFGPWRTDDATNMQVFVRRLLALMLELHSNKPGSRPNSRASPAQSSSVPSSRSSSASNHSRSPSAAAAGNRAPSATVNRAPGQSPSRKPTHSLPP